MILCGVLLWKVLYIKVINKLGFSLLKPQQIIAISAFIDSYIPQTSFLSSICRFK